MLISDRIGLVLVLTEVVIRLKVVYESESKSIYIDTYQIIEKNSVTELVFSLKI